MRHGCEAAIFACNSELCTHLHWWPAIKLWKIINRALDHPMAPPDVRFGLEINIFEQHRKSGPDLFKVSWDVDQRRTARGAG